MIRAVAFCPSAPVLVPEVAQGAAPELDDLRAACRDVIRTAVGAGRAVGLVAADTVARTFDPSSRGSLHGLGVPLEVALSPTSLSPTSLSPTSLSPTSLSPTYVSPTSLGRPVLPVSLSVGAWLVRDAVGPDVRIAATTVDATTRLTPVADLPLVVLGDGSACRTRKAPGYLDERAAAFDAEVEQALRNGTPQTLAGLDADLGSALLAAGAPAWRAIGPALVGQAWTPHLGYADDPYGVMYFAASWTARV